MRELIAVYRWYVRVMRPPYAIHIHGCVVMEKDAVLGIVPAEWTSPWVLA